MLTFPKQRFSKISELDGTHKETIDDCRDKLACAVEMTLRESKRTPTHWGNFLRACERDQVDLADLMDEATFDGRTALEILLHARDWAPLWAIHDRLPYGNYAQKRVLHTASQLTAVVNGLAEGPGIRWYEKGGYYSGTFVNGRAEGSGRRVYADGDKYEGEWLDGVKNGWGKEYSPQIDYGREGIFVRGLYQCNPRRCQQPSVLAQLQSRWERAMKKVFP